MKSDSGDWTFDFCDWDDQSSVLKKGTAITRNQIFDDLGRCVFGDYCAF